MRFKINNDIYQIVCIPFSDSSESSCLVFKNSSLDNQRNRLPNQRNRIKQIDLKSNDSLKPLSYKGFKNTNTIQKLYFSEIRKEFRKKVLQTFFYSLMLGLPYIMIGFIKVNTPRPTQLYFPPPMFAVIGMPSSGNTISTSPNLGEISQEIPTEAATTQITGVPSNQPQKNNPNVNKEASILYMSWFCEDDQPTNPPTTTPQHFTGFPTDEAGPSDLKHVSKRMSENIPNQTKDKLLRTDKGKEPIQVTKPINEHPAIPIITYTELLTIPIQTQMTKSTRDFFAKGKALSEEHSEHLLMIAENIYQDKQNGKKTTNPYPKNDPYFTNCGKLRSPYDLEFEKMIYNMTNVQCLDQKKIYQAPTHISRPVDLCSTNRGKKLSHKYFYAGNISRTSDDGAALVYPFGASKLSHFIAQLPLSSYISLMKQNFPNCEAFKKSTNEIIETFKQNPVESTISPPSGLFEIKYFPKSESILLPQNSFENLNFKGNNNDKNPFFDKNDDKRCQRLISSAVGMALEVDNRLERN